MKDLKLYLVTDSDILKGRDFYNCIEEALKGGVTMLQLREKNASGKEFLDKAMKLRNLTKKYNVKFIINDKIYGIFPSANIKYSPKHKYHHAK